MYPTGIPSHLHDCHLARLYGPVQLWVQSNRRQSLLQKSDNYRKQNWFWILWYLLVVYLHHHDLDRLWVVLAYKRYGEVTGRIHCYFWCHSQLSSGGGFNWVLENEDRVDQVAYYFAATRCPEEIIWTVSYCFSLDNKGYQNDNRG